MELWFEAVSLSNGNLAEKGLMADAVTGQVAHYPFVVYFHECLGNLWAVKTRIPTSPLLLLEASQKNFAWGAQGLCHLLGPGTPSFLGWLGTGFPLCATAVPVSEQCGVTENQFLAHTGSLTGTSTRLRRCQSPSPRGAQLTEGVSHQHFCLPPRAIKSRAEAAAGAVCGTSGCTRAIFVLQSWGTTNQRSCSSSTALSAVSRTCLSPWKMSCWLRCCSPQLPSTPDEATCVPVTPQQRRGALCVAAFPAQSACSWLPGYFKTVLKALKATSVNPGLLPRAFLHNSYSHSSCKINRLFYSTGCLIQEDPSKAGSSFSPNRTTPWQ